MGEVDERTGERADEPKADPDVEAILARIEILSNEQRQELFDAIEQTYCTATGIHLGLDSEHVCVSCTDEDDEDDEEEDDEDDEDDEDEGDEEDEGDDDEQWQ